MNRREFLRYSTAFCTTALVGSSGWERAFAAVMPGDGPYGPLLEPDENGIQLPHGFSARLLASALENVSGTDYAWHPFPDGGDTFEMPDKGWVYVSNSELFGNGGVGAIRFDKHGEIIDAYSIARDTSNNCAGGKTPWGTWLSCEEIAAGITFECDPTGQLERQARPALGTFTHEAVAVDLETGILYLTEDRPDGRFYRYVPNAWGNLTSGLLQVAEVGAQGDVGWLDLLDPNPNPFTETPTRHQVPASTPFDGGEGIVYSQGHIYFTTKGDNRVWDYLPSSEKLSVLYDDDQDPALPLTGVDNITASRSGDLIVAEDGGNMELVMITPDLEVAPIFRLLGQPNSELAGPAFDPKGKRLYVSSQRGGPIGAGLTYEITGPFRKSQGRAAPGRRR